MRRAGGIALRVAVVLAAAATSGGAAAGIVETSYQARDAAWQLGALRWCGARVEDAARQARYARAQTFVEGVVKQAVADGLLGREAADAFAASVEKDAALDGLPLTRERCDELGDDLAGAELPQAPVSPAASSAAGAVAGATPSPGTTP